MSCLHITLRYLYHVTAGIRAVGFVHSPLLKASNGEERTSLIHITDWMPTFMHIATGKAVDGAALGLDGVDQFSTITTGITSRDVSH